MKKITRKDFVFDSKNDKECKICGISSFSHWHPKGALIKDFERINKDEIIKFNNELPVKGMLEKAVKYSNLSQAIQMIVWQYMSLPKRKRNGVEMADKIIKLIKR